MYTKLMKTASPAVRNSREKKRRRARGQATRLNTGVHRGAVIIMEDRKESGGSHEFYGALVSRVTVHRQYAASRFFLVLN